MYIYLISFFLSALCISIGERSDTKIVRKLIVLIGLMIPCLLSGFRSEVIGTDINIYVRPLFEIAENATSFSDYLSTRLRSDYVYEMEIGFTTMVYIVTKLTSSMIVLLMVISIMIIFPIYGGIVYWKKQLDSGFTMLIFYFLYFNITLNIMRQFIAIAIIFYGIQYLYQNQKVKYLFIVGISILFHQSGVLGILILFIYRYMCKNSKFNIVYGDNKVVDEDILKIIGVIVITLFVLFTLTNFSSIFKLLNMEYYFNSYLNGEMSLSYGKLLVSLPMIILISLNLKSLKNKINNVTFLILMYALDIIVSQMHVIAKQSGRIAIYFGIYNIITYSLIASIKNNKQLNVILKVVIIIYVGGYWYYNYIYKGFAETYPYISVFGK